MSLAEYSFRLHAFRKEATFRLDEEALTVADPKGETVYPLRDIASIRLAYAPSRIRTRRYTMTIRLRDRRKLVLSNEHYAGPADFESRSEAYLAFVGALHRQLLALAVPVRYRAGSTPAGFSGTALVVISALIGLPLIGAFLVRGNGSFATMIGWAVVFALLPVLFVMIWRNWPRKYGPARIPSVVLP